MSKIFSARKFQIFPNENQKQIIDNTFGCCRFMWNKLLEKLSETFFNEEISDKIVNCCDIVSEHPFLDKSNKDLIIDRHAMSNEKTFLKQAYSKMWKIYRKNKNHWRFRKDGKPVGFPRFKKKTGKQSYTNYNVSRGYSFSIDWDKRLIQIPVVGWIKFSKREKPHPKHFIVSHVSISKSSSGKYYISICYHYEDDRDGIGGIMFIVNPKNELNILGLDYSSKSLYVDSNGISAKYPRYYRKSQMRLRMLQKRLSRQTKHGKNYEKTRVKLAKLHEHISNQRCDFLHKLSSSITKNYDVISVEDINMVNMTNKKGFKLGKSTMDNAFGMFREMIEYKQLRQPFHIVVKASIWFPSSKMCHQCGYINKSLELKDRVYQCPSCGLTIDRDWNAAINLRNEALRTINTWSERHFVLASTNHT